MLSIGNIVAAEFRWKLTGSPIDVALDSFSVVVLRNAIEQPDVNVNTEFNSATNLYSSSFIVPSWSEGDSIALRMVGMIGAQSASQTVTIGTLGSVAGLEASTSNYATIDDLLRRASINDIAEAAAPDDGFVRGETLKAALDDTNDGAYSADEQQALAKAVTRLNQLLTDASAEVDGYIKARYPTLTQAPHLLTVHTVDITLYRLFGGDQDSDAKQQYDRAMRYLEQVASGKIDILTSAIEQSSSSNQLAQASVPDSVYNDNSLTGF